MEENKENLKRMIREEAAKIVKEYMKSSAFTDRKLTDTPTDALSVVNRKYVDLSGATASRPVGSVTGQQYFDTTIGRPIYRKADGSWIDGAGSVS